MNDALDLDLNDADLSDEIRLVAELMVAAAQSPSPLSQTEIDAVLGSVSSPG